MRKCIAKIFKIIGVLLICVAIGIYSYSMYLDYISYKKSTKALDVIREVVKENTAPIIEETDDEDLPVISVENNDYIGILELSDINVTLPILNEWNEVNSKISPCRYRGDLVSEPLILAGHNSSSQFAKIKDLEVGMNVLFIDNYGVEHSYKVKEIVILDEKDVEKMVNTDYRLTLFTCTKNNKARVVVRCN